MNDIELNALLYYADYLSIRDKSIPVTDTCNYFFVYGVPINSTFLLDMMPDYDQENKYFQQAKQEYEIIKNKFGDEGVTSFVDGICNLKSAGHVNGEMMLKCIHQYSQKAERQNALKTYNNWKKNKKYFHVTINENGDPEQTECTKYVAHAERNIKKR